MTNSVPSWITVQLTNEKNAKIPQSEVKTASNVERSHISVVWNYKKNVTVIDDNNTMFCSDKCSDELDFDMIISSENDNVEVNGETLKVEIKYVKQLVENKNTLLKIKQS